MATMCSPPTTMRMSNANTSSRHPLMPLTTSIRGSPTAVPNKHIPFCSPGPQPKAKQTTSPSQASPLSCSTDHADLKTSRSLLYPPDDYVKLSKRSCVHLLDGNQLHSALEFQASQPLPDPSTLFPWLHGLHPENHVQLGFFTHQRKPSRRIPTTYRSITVIKAGGDLTHSRIKGAVSPADVLEPINTCRDTIEPRFADLDPKDGFSVRNFHVQTAKIAMLSDIVVYGDAQTSREEVRRLAQQVSQAQRHWRLDNLLEGVQTPTYNAFILTDSFGQVEQLYPDIIAIDSDRHMSDQVIDFSECERREMHDMSAPSEIAHNIWLGPTSALPLKQRFMTGCSPTPKFDFLIETVDGAQVPHNEYFDALDNVLNAPVRPRTAIPQLEFPGSGSLLPPFGSSAEIDGLLRTCEWLFRQAHGITSEDSQQDLERHGKSCRVDSAIGIDGDTLPSHNTDDLVSAPTESESVGRKGRCALIHCADGYTETTLLAVAYYVYANCIPVHQAYIDLHTRFQRNFFAYPSDLTFLSAAQPRLLQSSPLNRTAPAAPFTLVSPDPEWMAKCDGSLPSRITNHMYLGNLNHANNPALLTALGIGQVLSVGEPVTWTEAEATAFESAASNKLMYIDNVQDNGIDSLTADIEACLDFIERGRKAGTATLVHCRVGVSRSATICIAQIMRELDYSFPRAYCYVRARRLNVIIQPHLRFAYELLKWEEDLAARKSRPLRRDLEWATIAREIAALNRPYCRPSG